MFDASIFINLYCAQVSASIPGGDHKGRGLVFMVRERAAADIPFTVLFKCAARGLFDISLEVHTVFDAVDPALVYHSRISIS